MISSATEVREHYAWGAAFLVIALWQRRTIPRIRALSIAATATFGHLPEPLGLG